MVDNLAINQLVVITGMSGAGKTVVVQCFEDLGYFCVDNLPPTLLPEFLNTMKNNSDHNRMAVVMDLRGRDFFEQVTPVLEGLQNSSSFNMQILFLDADNETLVKRYKETRRAHPLSPNDLLLKGIEQERKLLTDLKEMAESVYNTSNLSPKELREKVVSQFSSGKEKGFQIFVTSFGYKHGIPIDADLAFDVRFLPNPFYLKELRPQTGLDEPVSSYVMQSEIAQTFTEKLVDMLDFVVPLYEKEGKSQLVIAIGCTGGQHRSVTIAEILQKHFSGNYATHITHRDIMKKKLTLHE